MYTFPQIILNKMGHSYLGHSSNYISHNDLQKKLNDIIKTKDHKNANNYFVFEIQNNKAVLIAAQSNRDNAIFYFNAGDNSKRLIAHFDTHFFNVPTLSDLLLL